MKIRADKFVRPATQEAIEQIQTEVQQYTDEFTDIESMEDAERLLYKYLSISIDEGYRKALEETEGRRIEIKPRRKGVVEYVDEGDVTKAAKDFKKRLNSKRQRKYFFKKEEATEESFVLAMVIHTGFEYGYMKLANDVGELINVTSKHPDIVKDMMKDMLSDYTTR